jgi:hypothetical protein
MSTNEHNVDAEAVADLEKARCRRNRRPSVQFIDKNLIKRRSSVPEKQHPSIQRKSRLASIHSNEEAEAAEVDRQQRYCETL